VGRSYHTPRRKNSGDWVGGGRSRIVYIKGERTREKGDKSHDNLVPSMRHTEPWREWGGNKKLNSTKNKRKHEREREKRGKCARKMNCGRRYHLSQSQEVPALEGRGEERMRAVSMATIKSKPKTRTTGVGLCRATAEGQTMDEGSEREGPESSDQR